MTRISKGEAAAPAAEPMRLGHTGADPGMIEQAVKRAIEDSLTHIFSELHLKLDDDRKRKAAGEAVQALGPLALPSELPPSAPERYMDRPTSEATGRRENIVEFLRRVWRPWIAADLLSRAALRKLDPEAEKAVENWLFRNKEMPADLNLLTYVRVLSKLPPARRDSPARPGA